MIYQQLNSKKSPSFEEFAVNDDVVEFIKANAHVAVVIGSLDHFSKLLFFDVFVQL